MGLIFTKVIEMSMTAILLMVAVVLIRILFKKAPKWFMGILWAVVALRLTVPIQIQSVIGFMPNVETIVTSALSKETVAEISEQQKKDVHETVGIMADVQAAGEKEQALQYATNNVDNKVPFSEIQSEATENVKPTAAYSVLQIVWLIGVMLVISYAAFCYVSIYKKTRISMRYNCTSKVYICDEIDTPFIFGIFNPVIYLPSGLDHKTISNVLAHERVHLERFDHIRKQLGFLIVAIHWFNPLVWISYILFCRDIELACDERVISTMSAREKKSYARSLLECSTQKRVVSVYPVAFGEVGVGIRIRQILNYKKPSYYLVMLLIVVTLGLATCSFTRAADKVSVSPYGLTILQEKDNTDKTPDDIDINIPEIGSITYTGYDTDIEEVNGTGVMNLPYKGEKVEVITLPKKDDKQEIIDVQKDSAIFGNKIVNVNTLDESVETTDSEPEDEKDSVSVVISQDSVNVNADDVAVKIGEDNVNVSVDNVEVKVSEPIVNETAGVEDNSNEQTPPPVNDASDNVSDNSAKDVVSDIAEDVVESVFDGPVSDVVEEVNNVAEEVVDEVANDVAAEVVGDVFDEADNAVNFAFDAVDTISSLFGR